MTETAAGPGHGAGPLPVRPPHRGRQLLAIGLAVLATVPSLAVRISGEHPSDVAGTAVFGLAVVGAAFLLAFGAEALQMDVSRGLALAVLALIAVLPEYAVDFTFAAKAGTDPDQYAPLALANMTGGNRLLIGIGWPLVVFVAAWRIRSTARAGGYTGPVDTEARLDRSHSVDIAFLTVATLYSLTLPLKSHITLWDAAILILLYVAYAVRISRAPTEEPHLVGPAELLGSLPTKRRRVVVAGVLGFAALVIILSAEPFAESLVATGSELGIDTFLLVQWLAPLASEAPELIVAALFAWRLNTNGGLGTLVSSKVNQWTLLVGSLPIVFVVAGGASSGLPIDSLQREELFLTAAQSVFAVAVLMSRSIDVREAFALLALFLSQFVLGGVLPEDARHWERIGVGIVYIVLATCMFWAQRRSVTPTMRDGLVTPVGDLVHEAPTSRARCIMSDPIEAQDDGIDWRVVLRGALLGLAIIVPVTVLRVVLDREIRDFDDSGWIYPLFVLVLVGYFAAGLVGGRARPDTPLMHGTLAAAGVLVLWIPVRIVIWAVREDGRGLFSGDDAALRPGQVFGAFVIACGVGMLGAVLGSHLARRRAGGDAGTIDA